MKPAHGMYTFLFCFSMGITFLSQFVANNYLYTILLSIGCGGIASVTIAWLIDIRNFRQARKENNYKFSLIMNGYVQLYKRLLFVAANECCGLYHDEAERSFEEWLKMLCNEERYLRKGAPTMGRRCEFLAGTVHAIQEYLERFQAQSAVLILGGYPNIDKMLDFFTIQHIHCWGTLNLLRAGNYKAFCETTNILYVEFIKMFPEYSQEFPQKYNIEIAMKWIDK